MGVSLKIYNKNVNYYLQDALDCAQKMLVTLTLENNRLYETESLQFMVACVNSPTGQCPCPCDYNNDPGCLCRDLRRSVNIGVTKTPVYALYPVSQPRTFNGRPYEVICMSICYIYKSLPLRWRSTRVPLEMYPTIGVIHI